MRLPLLNPASKQKRFVNAIRLVEKETSPFIPWQVQFTKRAFDLVVAGFAVFLTLPLWPLIALLIRLDSNGSVIFSQLRIGEASEKETRLFCMYKFRTMRVDAERQSGPVWAKQNDPRITPVGVFLRKTRLDELPQLINVINGDMSLVGPRPERPGITRNIEHNIPYFVERTYGLKPGITGLSQVHQGYDTSMEDVRRKLAYDLSYSLSLRSISEWLMTDLGIMLKTLWVMITGRGR